MTLPLSGGQGPSLSSPRCPGTLGLTCSQHSFQSMPGHSNGSDGDSGMTIRNVCLRTMLSKVIVHMRNSFRGTSSLCPKNAIPPFLPGQNLLSKSAGCLIRLTTPTQAHGTSFSIPGFHRGTVLFVPGALPPLCFLKTVPEAFGVEHAEPACWTPVGLSSGYRG